MSFHVHLSQWVWGGEVRRVMHLSGAALEGVPTLGPCTPSVPGTAQLQPES